MAGRVLRKHTQLSYIAAACLCTPSCARLPLPRLFRTSPRIVITMSRSRDHVEQGLEGDSGIFSPSPFFEVLITV